MDVAALYDDRSQWPVLSAETFPTENHRPIDPILTAIEDLLPHNIRVVTTTWGALGSARGGTPSISRIIHEKFHVPTVVHFNIQGKSRQDIEGLLRGLHLDGLHNILALGGDPPAGRTDHVPEELRHRYASDLVEQIVHLNEGRWIAKDGTFTREGSKTRFGIGVVGFPECHPDDWDKEGGAEKSIDAHVELLKHKINAGGQYLIEQMIFDADLHFKFLEKVRAAGIDLPIIPGVMPFERYKQVSRFLGEELRISMPKADREQFENTPEDDQPALADEFTGNIVQKLLEGGVPGIHFYCMNKSGATIRALARARS